MSEIALIEAFLKENADYVRDKYAVKSTITVASKADANDLLTEVDLTIQKRFVDRIAHECPGDVIVGEEGEYTRFPENPDARAWVIDPIDGTYNFMRGLFPIFGVSIAFSIGGAVLAGGVLFPATDRTFLAAYGAGSYCNGKRLHVSDVQQVNEARIDVDFCGPVDRMTLMKTAPDLIAKVGMIRCHGSAVASICEIASGDADGYLHMTLNPWDYAASQIIVEEAGGMASRLDGSPLELFDGRQGVIISNGAIHHEVLASLNP